MKEYERLLHPRQSTVTHDAGFIRRAMAFIFDILLIDLVVTAPWTTLMQGLVGRSQTQGLFSVTYTDAEFTMIVLIFLIAYTYFVLFEYILGQTPGMMVLGISPDGSLRLWQAALRNSFLIPTIPFLLFWLIEPIAISVTKRGVLEQLTRTRTIYRREIML